MEIKYLGHSSFRLKTKNVTVVTDPFDAQKVGLPFAKLSCDVVTISHEHDDHNNLDKMDGKPLVFRGPGEYEVEGVRIYGYQTYHDDKKGQERGANTMFLYDMDGVRILHCGDIGHELSDSLVDEMGDVDIMLVPVGGHFTIDAKQAHKLVRQVEPSIVIPMHYKVKSLSSMFDELTGVDVFLKEMDKEPEHESKLSITKDSLPTELSVVVLS